MRSSWPARFRNIWWRITAGLVTADQLRALHPAPESRPINSTPSYHSQTFNLEEFLSHLGIAYTQDSHEGRERYKLDHCPFNPEHGKGEAAIFRGADGKLGFRCQHDSCGVKHWKDVRELVDEPPEARTSTTENKHASNGATANGTEAEAIITCAADVKPQPITWLWPGASRLASCRSLPVIQALVNR
jgi:hypothetical protein